MAKKRPKLIFPWNLQIMPDYHEIHSGGKKHYQQQDLSWFSMKLFISFDTDQNLFFVTIGIKVNYLQYPEVPYVPMFFNLSVSNCSSTFRWETWGQLFLQVFYFDFSKKGIFKGNFNLFFDREEQSQNNFLHYKPCPLTSLSSRKSWEIFAKNFKGLFFTIRGP